MTERQDSRLPTVWELMRTFTAANLPLVMLLVVYAQLAASPPYESAWQLLVTYLVVATAITFPINAIALHWFHRPIGRLQKQLDGGEAAVRLPARDVRRALSLDRTIAVFVFAEWSLATVFWSVVAWLSSTTTAALFIPYVLAGGLAVSISIAVICFYAFALMQRSHIAPVLLASGSLSHLEPFRAIRIWHHMGLLILMLGVVQPVTVLVFSLAGPIGPSAIGVVLVMALSISVFQAWAALRGVTAPAGHLVGRMSKIRQGSLACDAQVGGLDTFGQLCSDFNSMLGGLRQREKMREMFGRYLTQQVADEILADRVVLGGELKTATVLFSDIRGFTRMSEKMSPQEIVRFLNRYLTIMVECVDQHGGYLDKFIGDAVMAVFGVPVQRRSVERDARAALSCAIQMSERLDTLNEIRLSKGEPAIEIGIGLHTGTLVAGAIGSSQSKLEYTVIGDTVNLTSRLESMTKQLGRRILVSSETARLVGDAYALEPLDELPVRGRDGRVEVYSLA